MGEGKSASLGGRLARRRRAGYGGFAVIQLCEAIQGQSRRPRRLSVVCPGCVLILCEEYERPAVLMWEEKGGCCSYFLC